MGKRKTASLVTLDEYRGKQSKKSKQPKELRKRASSEVEVTLICEHRPRSKMNAVELANYNWMWDFIFALPTSAEQEQAA